MSTTSLSAVIVAHESLKDLWHALPPLRAQLGEHDELIVVDNASSDGLAEELPRLDPEARLIRLTENLGFAEGANRGAAAAHGEVIVFLNPDAVVQPGWADAIRAPAGRFGAWMGLVLMADGRRINTSGGVLHFTGFGWSGQVGEPAETAPAAPAEVPFLSGACLAIPRATWRATGGFPADFFMYCEDVDLSLRLRLAGARLAVIPAARVAHGYDFAKGQLKWRLLERNRWATVIRTYPAALLAAVLPAMLVTELAVWVIAARGGWARMKLLATIDLLRSAPRLLRERRAIQGRRRVSSAEFAASLTPALSSPYFGAAGAHPLLAAILRGYWRVVTALVSARPGRCGRRGPDGPAAGPGQGRPAPPRAAPRTGR
jgi:GT2 family glycosyltransferase